MPDSDSQKGMVRLSGEIGSLLERSGRKITTVESCTGGGVAYMLTAIAGSSGWFETGFVTYSNEAKSHQVGVPGMLLEIHGAVSEQVAAAMAEGALAETCADYALSVTGIAGPGGGSREKPVGMVCFGWASRFAKTVTDTRIFEGDREEVRNASIVHSLERLKSLLETGQVFPAD